MSFSEKLKETMQDLDLNQKQVVGMTGGRFSEPESDGRRERHPGRLR